MLHQLFRLKLLYLLIPLFVCSCVNEATASSSCQKNASLRISFLNVGQGDATLVSCLEENRHLLIDAGDSSVRYPEAEALIKNALHSRLKTKRLDYAVATHPHLDHVAGFSGLLNKDFQIAEFIDNAEYGDIAKLYHDIKSHVISSNGKTRSIAIGQSHEIELCQKLRVTLTSPPETLAPLLGCPANLNDCSLNANIEITTKAGNVFRITVLADKTYDWEKVVLSQNLLRPTAVLRTGHHGNLSTSSDLLAKTKPAFAIISAGQAIGANAALGYPRLDSIQNLNDYFTAHFGKSFRNETTSVCNWQAGQCHWQESQMHERILDTRNGSIDLFIKDENFCVVQ